MSASTTPPAGSVPLAAAAVQKHLQPSTTSPIEVLPGSTSQAYTHIHTALLLVFYYLRFNDLVADPVPTLLDTLLPLAVLQISYAAICLPAGTGAGAATSLSKASKSAGASTGNTRRKTQQGSKSDGRGLGTRISTSLLATILSLALGTPLLTIILVFFGAPVTTHSAHTLLCAAHMALLAGIPLVHAHGVDTGAWRDVAAALMTLDEPFGGAVGVAVGAWLGAVPIPLDWDREWQKWPVTILTGAYIGYAVGKAAGGYIFRGKRIQFD
ncbi:hypothetical protein L228DRAFT_246361 [Xylona heveae TC161]|uniref:Glycosylphosphatidylinositol anchor biosynthesis protein 11 n=1 Tax=Xylona heveae (strain CBS 132557 / TC161) TaxID=1328760 RepID=A0A161TCN9_XYLHT|nr:hypothetical protein L228DRAFT_246361 [Xylona heveae TC161]KZF23567.1 hypothetical protein L228DRAFT_246361 [Xylona heveae TC161]